MERFVFYGQVNGVKLYTPVAVEDERTTKRHRLIFGWHSYLGGCVASVGPGSAHPAIQFSEVTERNKVTPMVDFPVALLSGRVERALILGVGAGFFVKRLLATASVQRIVAVDIDWQLVEHATGWFPVNASALVENPRVDCVEADARTFLEDCDESFDLIILDVSDGFTSPHETGVYTEEFYKRARECLSPRGVFQLHTAYFDIARNRWEQPHVLRELEWFAGHFAQVKPTFAGITDIESGLYWTCSREPLDVDARIEAVVDSDVRARLRSICGVPPEIWGKSRAEVAGSRL